MSRIQARKNAFLMIYQKEFHSDFMMADIYENTLQSLQDFEETEEELLEEDCTFSREIASGTIQNLAQIDPHIVEHCKKWSFERLNKVDVAILRMAIYEILFREDIHESISINEAVNLAKIYGTDESPAFINGILGKMIRSGAFQRET